MPKKSPKYQPSVEEKQQQRRYAAALQAVKKSELPDNIRIRNMAALHNAFRVPNSMKIDIAKLITINNSVYAVHNAYTSSPLYTNDPYFMTSMIIREPNQILSEIEGLLGAIKQMKVA